MDQWLRGVMVVMMMMVVMMVMIMRVVGRTAGGSEIHRAAMGRVEESLAPLLFTNQRIRTSESIDVVTGIFSKLSHWR
ncbi:hypothetical protein LZ023_40395 (plasmid) [Pseudomonas silvicola]|nr:hypothetical protein LZ023_40395 [Pseudomonas silvicola]